MKIRPSFGNLIARSTRIRSRLARRRPRARPRIELLEARAVPAVFTVNTLADVVDNDRSTMSLREAVIAANQRVGPDQVDFAENLNGAIVLTGGRLRITSPLTITGPDLNDITIVGLNNKAFWTDPDAGKVTVDNELNVMDGRKAPATTPLRPRLLGVTAVDSTTLVLDFNTRLGTSAALASSYSIPGVSVNTVIATRFPNRVVLVTSPQDDVSYSVSLNNLLSRDGRKVQVINGAGKLTGIDSGLDLEPPRIVGAVSLGNNRVLVSFSEAMADTALDPSHYSITQTNFNSEAGTLTVRGDSPDVAPVFLNEDRMAVVLTTSPQNELTYTVKVVNVTDLAGNSFAPTVLSASGQKTVSNQADFAGSPPSGNQLVDSDGDGLTDNEEQRGWEVDFKTADGRKVQRWVTSDPAVVDTDGDGFPDNVEAQLKIDPRDTDTDDDLLSDWQEYTEIFSDHLNADTDGDGVDDGTEFLGVRSSPNFADTDGDQIPDGEEIPLGGFYNVLVANLPTPKIEVGNVNLSLRVDTVATSSKGTRKLDSKTAESTLSTSDNYSYSSTSESTQSAYAKLGYTQNVHTSSKTLFPYDDTIESEVGWSGSWRSEYTSSSSRETQRALSDARTTEKEVQVGEDIQTQVSDAKIQTSINLSNASPIAYRLKNLQVTALMVDPRNPTELVPVATLVPEVEPEDGFAMGPLVPTRGPIIMTSQNVYPNRVEALMANPQSLIFQISNFDILDESDRNFAFSSQDVVERTARIEIDYGGLDANGDGRDDGAEIMYVATAGGRAIEDTNGDGTIDGSDRRVTFDPAGYQVAAASATFWPTRASTPTSSTSTPPTTLILDPDYDPALRVPLYFNQDGEQVKLTDAQIKGSYATMMVNIANPDGSTTPVERIYRIRQRANNDFDSSTWEVLTPTGIDSAKGLDDVLYTGQSFTLAFVQDKDGDFMPASLEAIYGSSDTSKDTDGDGLDDRFESLIGWDINVPGRGIIHVTSNPALADTDGDGLSDRAEAPGRWVDANGNGLMDAGELRRAAPIYANGWADYWLNLYTPNGSGDYDYFTGEMVGWIYEQRFNPEQFTSVLVRAYDDPVSQRLAGLYSFDENSDGYSDVLDYRAGTVRPFTDFVTDPTDPDTDRDRLSDFEEVNGFTYRPIDSPIDLVAHTNPELADSDGDTVSDGLERRFGLDPSDGLDRDTDHDGLPDRVETAGWDVTIEQVTTTPLEVSPGRKVTFSKVQSDPSKADTDGDGLTDFEEYFLKTLPADAFLPTDINQGQLFLTARGIDSDGDGISDFDEVRGFQLVGEGRDEALVTTSPLDADVDNDGLSDGEEAGLGIDAAGNRFNLGFDYRWVVKAKDAEPRRVYTDPREPDGDNDQLPDGAEKYQTEVQVINGVKTIVFSQQPFELLAIDWSGANVPASGKNLVVIGLDANNKFHVRIFDSRGNTYLDQDETQLHDVSLPFVGSDIGELKYVLALRNNLADAAAKDSFIQSLKDSILFLLQFSTGALPDARILRGADPENSNTDGDRWSDYEEALLGTNPAVAGYKITIQFDYLQFGSGDADDGDIGNGPPGEIESSLLGGADVDLNAYVRLYDPNSSRLFNLGDLEKFFDPGGDITIWSNATHVKQGSTEKFSGTTPRSTTFELADGQAFSLGVLLKEVDNIDTNSNDYVQVILGDYADGGVDIKVDDGTKRSAIFTSSDIKSLLDSKDSQVGIFSLVFEFAKSDNTDPKGVKGANDKMTGKLAFKMVVE